MGTGRRSYSDNDDDDVFAKRPDRAGDSEDEEPEEALRPTSPANEGPANSNEADSDLDEPRRGKFFLHDERLAESFEETAVTRENGGLYSEWDEVPATVAKGMDAADGRIAITEGGERRHLLDPELGHSVVWEHDKFASLETGTRSGANGFRSRDGFGNRRFRGRGRGRGRGGRGGRRPAENASPAN